MTPEAFWQAVLRRLETGHPVFIALVVANTRGSPGTLGARLLLDTHGAVEGTIGGAIMEAELIETGNQRLRDVANGQPVLQRLAHRKKNTRGAEPSGLICAGEQTNLSLVLDPKRDIDAVRQFCTAIEHQRSASATLSIDAHGLHVVQDEASATEPGMGLIEEGVTWHYRETSVAPRRIAVVGGGHCGKALANLAKQLGYWVDVYDNRAAVLSGEEWSEEVRRHALDDYGELNTHLAYPELTTAVVMTAAVVHDITALASIADSDLRWFGVMGSAAKIHEIKTQLRKRGISQERIEALHGPIGLPMKSDTPAEIAVSIMGQLLSERL